MQFINVVVFALCAVTAIDALRCHQSGWGGSAGTLVDVPQRYHWESTDRKFGVCYVYDKGERGYKSDAFRGDIDYVCVNSTFYGGHGACWCATDGCNAEMPHVEAHMSPVVNCVSPGGGPYQCGGDKSFLGNVCATEILLSLSHWGPHQVWVTERCMVSLGEKECMTENPPNADYYVNANDFHTLYCVGNVTIKQT